MNVWLYVNRGELPAISFKRLSLGCYEEFLKVPRNIGPADGTPNQEFGVLHEGVGVVVGIGEFLFEIGEDGMCVSSIDITLLKDGEIGLESTTWTYML